MTIPKKPAANRTPAPGSGKKVNVSRLMNARWTGAPEVGPLAVE